MEIQLCQAQNSYIIRFLVVFLVMIGYSGYASCYEQTHFVGKYIAKTYFEKYDYFIDSQFNSFIRNEILRYKSNVASIIDRKIVGEGSHRRLSSSMRFKMHPELKSELNSHSCEVIIIERLPSGVFADPFELQHLVDRGVFNDAGVFGDTNLEQPSFRSNQSVVEIHMNIASEGLSSYEDDSEIKLEVPLHARYAPLGAGFSRVEFGQPDLFLCYRNSLNRSCSYMPISEKKAGNSVIWDIPCGIKEHARVVSAVTFGSAVVAALLIVVASICYSDSTSFDKHKHS